MITTSAQLITRAKFRLGLENTSEHDLYLLKLAQEALRGLNASSTFTVSCETVEIECGSAKLPCQYDSLVGFVFNNCGACSGCCNGAVTGGDALVAICECRTMYTYSQMDVISHRSYGWYGSYFAINGQFLTFPSTITATEVTIYYKGFNVDADGLMIIDEEVERGASAYMAAQFSLDRANTNPPTYTPEQRSMWMAEWIAQKNYINGKKIIKDWKLQKGQISLIVNAIMINRRNVGFGSTL